MALTGGLWTSGGGWSTLDWEWTSLRNRKVLLCPTSSVLNVHSQPQKPDLEASAWTNEGRVKYHV